MKSVDWAEIVRRMNDPETPSVVKETMGSTCASFSAIAKRWDELGIDPISDAEDRREALNENRAIFGKDRPLTKDERNNK